MSVAAQRQKSVKRLRPTSGLALTSTHSYRNTEDVSTFTKSTFFIKGKSLTSTYYRDTNLSKFMYKMGIYDACMLEVELSKMFNF